MERIYQRILWENEPSTATPLDEDNLNRMDAALYVIDGRVVENRQLIEGLENYEARAAEAAAEAEASAQAASDSETAAGLSEYNAKQSEDNAKASEDNAKLSETNAKTSENNALASEQAAAQSETNAHQSEVNAATSEENALESEEKAEIYMRNASTSAVNASRSAATAKGYMDEAENSSLDSEAWAVGERDSVPVEPSDITYENNSKFYAQQSKLQADRAEDISDALQGEVTEINKKLSLGTFSLNANGHLVYTDYEAYRFNVDNNGHLNWEVA